MTLIRGEESQAAFAPTIGIHKNTLGTYERGEREIGAEALLGLSRRGWNLRWILDGEGPERIDDALAGLGGVARAAQDAVDEAVIREFGPEPVRHELLRAVALVDEASGDLRDLSSQARAQLVASVYDVLVSEGPARPAQLIRMLRNAIRLREG